MIDEKGGHIIFFFKQKSAYEMRISDWSSDVCSSDLCARARLPRRPRTRRARRGPGAEGRHAACRGRHAVARRPRAARRNRGAGAVAMGAAVAATAGVRGARRDLARARSEEHTSELQSLLRTSYAVFCLKTKKQLYIY